MSYYGRGYLLKSYSVSRALYKYIWSLTENIRFSDDPEDNLRQRKKYHRFLSHLYVSMMLQVIKEEVFSAQKGFIPIYSRRIERMFGRDFDVHLLKKEKIIKIKEHDTARKISREFRLRENIYRKAISIEDESIFTTWGKLCKGINFANRDVVNLMTGRKEPSVIKSKYTKDEGDLRNTNISKLVKNSIGSLVPCPFNPKYVAEWAKDLREKYKRERVKLKKIKKQYGTTSHEYKSSKRALLKAKGRYYNILLSLRTILNQIPTKLPVRSSEGDPLYQYKGAYQIQMSGRITEIHGGFQSSSQYFKRSFFRDMPKMKCNYDLKNSQALILLQELKACNIKCCWLESYLNDPDAKKTYAKKVEIPVGIWKNCFYALIMGAEARSEYGAVYKALKEYYKGDKAKTKRAHALFIKYARELILATNEWRNYIYESTDRRYHYQHDKTKYWKNACGMHFKDYGKITDSDGCPVLVKRSDKSKEIRNKQDIDKCKRKLAAFILQGQEACFIHHLTFICSNNGIPVYKNEHDGIITGKKIPESLITEASEKSGLEGPKLIRKPLCDKHKRREMRNYVED